MQCTYPANIILISDAKQQLQKAGSAVLTLYTAFLFHHVLVDFSVLVLHTTLLHAHLSLHYPRKEQACINQRSKK